MTLPVQAQDLTLRMPPEMIASGFDKHLLTRFRFKHRIDVAAVEEGGDMVLGETGRRVFADGATEWHVEIATSDSQVRARAETFLDWLASDPGRAAIEGFAPEGSALYTTEKRAVAVVEQEIFEGDEKLGSDLALSHCGRCHVVDKRNRMGGIGSTPSFTALRARENWSDLFAAFYAANPHPSFTQVVEVTEPFESPPHIAPVEITLDEIDAILAFVATLEPKNLGAPVRSQ